MQLPASSAKQCVPCTAMKSWIEGVVVAPAETGIGTSKPAIPSAIVATTNHRGVLPLIVPLLTESRFGGRPSTGWPPHQKRLYARRKGFALRPPGVAEKLDGADEPLGDDRLDSVGNGWTEVQPGELVRRHPLPAGEHGIRAINTRLGSLPYLSVKHQVDDMPVGRQHLADDDQLPDPDIETELLHELAPQGGVERLQALEPPTRQHPVTLPALAMLQQQDLVVTDDDGRHAQLRRDRVKRVHQGGETDQRCAHRSLCSPGR